MSQYLIAELRDGEQGGFNPRGAAEELWKFKGHECLLAGPAETGKTFSACQKIDALLWKYAGAQGVMCRKTYASLVGSAVQTYKRIIGYNSGHCPIKSYGGDKPEWFTYPNGSRLWVIGLDNPQKALSSERDFFYVNQAEELSLEDWETLLTRCTGRGAVMPYTQMLGDCNPGPPSHWILHRAGLQVFHSRHEDNPTLYEADGTITPQGVRTMAILDSLTGVRYQRLRLGKWVQAEGAVYEEFTRAQHVKSKEWLIERGVFKADGSLNRDKIKKVVAGQDWGWTNPGVMLISAVDGDGVNYVIREIYMSRRLIEWWAAKFVAMVIAYGIDSIDCDPAEPAFIKAFSDALAAENKRRQEHNKQPDAAKLPILSCTVQSGINDILPGIQAVQERLKSNEQKQSRLYFYDGMLEEQDEELLANKQPVSTLQEMDLYVWPKGVDGKPVKEKPVDMYNHGCDTARYLIMRQNNLPRAHTLRVFT